MKHLSFTNVLLASFLVRLLVFGSSIGDSFVLIGLAGLYGFDFFLQSKKEPPINEQTKSDLAALRAEVETLRGSISAIKAVSSMKGFGRGNG